MGVSILHAGKGPAPHILWHLAFFGLPILLTAWGSWFTARVRSEPTPRKFPNNLMDYAGCFFAFIPISYLLTCFLCL
jgi:hypothetical protein